MFGSPVIFLIFSIILSSLSAERVWMNRKEKLSSPDLKARHTIIVDLRIVDSPHLYKLCIIVQLTSWTNQYKTSFTCFLTGTGGTTNVTAVGRKNAMSINPPKPHMLKIPYDKFANTSNLVFVGKYATSSSIVSWWMYWWGFTHHMRQENCCLHAIAAKSGSKWRIECSPAMLNGTYSTTRWRLRAWNVT